MAEEEDYPTRTDLLRAGALALVSGLAGFGCSYALFVKPSQVQKVLPTIDRKAAEKSLPSAYQAAARGQAAAWSAGYQGSLPAERPQHRSKLEIKVPSFQTKPAPAVASPAPQAPSPKPLALKLPQPQEPPGSRPAPTQKNGPLLVVSPSPTLPAERPAEVSREEAWQRLAPAWVSFGGGPSPQAEGVVVAGGEILTTLSGYLASGGRGWLAGQAISTTLEASDPNLDLALLKVSSPWAGFALPLSPEGPERDQVLLCSRPGGYQEVISLGLAGDCAGFRGWTFAPSGGAPLVNSRGELVALALPRPAEAGLCWNLCVGAPQLAGFLQQRPKLAGQPLGALEHWGRVLRSRVTPVSERVAPHRANGRVLAGQSLGNYPLGLSGEHLRQELGQAQVHEAKGGFSRWHYAAPRLSFFLSDDLVVAVESDYPFYTSEQGWSPGQTISPLELRQRAPQASEGPGAVGLPGLEVYLRGGSISQLRVVPL